MKEKELRAIVGHDIGVWAYSVFPGGDEVASVNFARVPGPEVREQLAAGGLRETDGCRWEAERICE